MIGGQDSRLGVSGTLMRGRGSITSTCHNLSKGRDETGGHST